MLFNFIDVLPQVKRLAAAAIALKGIGGIFFIFGSNLGAFLLVGIWTILYGLLLIFMSKIFILISHSTGHSTLVSCECPGCFLTLSCWVNYSFTSVDFLSADFASTDCYSYFIRFLQLWKLEYRIYSTFHRIYTGFYTATSLFLLHILKYSHDYNMFYMVLQVLSVIWHEL